MCLGIPVKIMKISDSLADVEIGGVRRQASLALVDDVGVGDFVILHAGFAIQRVDEDDAKETLRLLKEIGVIGI
ncbi:HypC/HybG/HupF family hydrogenase formation chaperone [bacterium]|nr:HypC/HybG/HupF family hydrogenase formation chaperone [bacterium]MBU1752655.1 HypC/HybG/HupF family hydrogenase formation chaperone [bacterium]